MRKLSDAQASAVIGECDASTETLTCLFACVRATGYRLPKRFVYHVALWWYPEAAIFELDRMGLL